MRIHFLTTRHTRRAHAFTYPLRVFAPLLKLAGIQIRLFYRADDAALTKCDVLGILSDYFGMHDLIAKPDDVVALLVDFQKHVRTLIWFDVTDGTGTLFEPAFSVVDVYAKKQLLRDRTLYRQPYFEREYHLHYYYEHYNDELAPYGEKARIVNHRGLDEKEIEKLRLSWNIGLGDYNTFWGRGRSIRPYWPLASFATKKNQADDVHRPIHVSYRVGTTYIFPAIPFHRLSVWKQLAELAQQHSDYVIHYEGKLPYQAYIKELIQTCIAPSPFGWGEICWRDFEVFLCGALLLKPDMDHLETWPDYYEKDVTYVAHQWDFSDVQEQVTHLLGDLEHCHTVARTGQERYLSSLSRRGGTRFVRQFTQLINEALQVAE